MVARVPRPERVRVEARARTGQRIVVEAGGLLGRILQHPVQEPGPERRERNRRGVLPPAARPAEAERERDGWD